MYDDRARLASLWEQELATFRRLHPRSGELAERARAHLPDGVPMLWMAKWPGDWPVYVAEAGGAHFTCVDGIDHVDLCLGDTGAMVGHAPAASVAAISAQLARGSTFMLPTEDAGIATLGIGGEYALRPAFEAIKLAGNQRLEGKLVVAELRGFDLEALLLGEVARCQHQENAGIGLGLDQAVPPDFFLRRAGRGKRDRCSGNESAKRSACAGHGDVPP